MTLRASMPTDLASGGAAQPRAAGPLRGRHRTPCSRLEQSASSADRDNDHDLKSQHRVKDSASLTRDDASPPASSPEPPTNPTTTRRRARRSSRRARLGPAACRRGRRRHTRPQRAGTAVYRRSMFDNPPPSTMTSGSSRLMTLRERARQPLFVPLQTPDRGTLVRRGAPDDLARCRRPPRRRRRSRRRGRVPTGTSRCSRAGRNSTAVPDARRRAARAADCVPIRRRWRWPPPSTRRSTTMPPPTPVPRMTPNTTARAGRRAVGRLRQREAVGVVGESHRPAERGAADRRRADGRSARSSSRS